MGSDVYCKNMAVKKIIQDAFEQVVETGRDVAKSSAEQVKQTFNPWDMIRNSFSGESASPEATRQTLSPEQGVKNKKSTPLNFDALDSRYKKQDEQGISTLQQRLFQIVKRDEERGMQTEKQTKAHNEQNTTQELAVQKRNADEKRRQQSFSNAPQGRTGRGTALMGKKRKHAAEPQPAETKPGSGKQ